MKIKKYQSGKKNFWVKLAHQLQTAPSNGETTLSNTNAIRNVIIEKARENAVAKGEDPNRAEEDIMHRTGIVAAAFPLALGIAGAGTAIAANPALYGKAAFETATSIAVGTGVDDVSKALTGKTFGENVAYYTGADKVYQNNALARFGFDMLNPGYVLGGGVGKTVLGRIYPTVFNPNVGRFVSQPSKKSYSSPTATVRKNATEPTRPNITVISAKKPWRSDPTKVNDTRRFYISGQENKGYFELVKDFEDGNYSVHFKPTDASNPNAFSEIEKKALFQAVADAVPQGGNISTWGSVSPGGIAGINRFGNLGFIQTGTRDVIMKGAGASVKIPIFTKPMYESPTIKETSFIPKNDIALKKLTRTEINSPEWDLLDAPAVPENYGSSYYSNQVHQKEIQRLQKVETVVNNNKPVSKIDIAKKKFLNKSVREQDDMVRAFIGERFSSFESLKRNPKELKRFWDWISR